VIQRGLVIGGADGVGSPPVQRLLRLGEEVSMLDPILYGDEAIVHTVHPSRVNAAAGEVAPSGSG